MPDLPVSRRSFLKIFAVSGTGTLLAACGKLSSNKGIQPLVPAEQPMRNPLSEATASPVITGAPRSTPPPNTRLPPNWTRGKVARERTLIYNGEGNNEDPNCNPLAWNGRLLEGGAYYSATADKTILWMLENYQFSADTTELTLKYRAGIEWSDGKPFTSEDAQFGFETALKLGWSEITGVEAIDALTIKVKLPKSDWRFFNRNLVYSYWNGNPSLLLPKHIFRNFTDQQLQSMSIYGQGPYSSNLDFTFSFFDPERNYPIVTGPYMMVKTDPEILKEFNYVGVNVYDLRPDWWAVTTGLVSKMPDVERVITVALEDAPEMNVKQFAEDRVDFWGAYSIDPETIRTIFLEANQISTWTGDQPPYGHAAPDVGGLGFNCQQAPFDDPRVRWAVAYAIDQYALLDQVYGKDVKAAKSPFPDYPGFQKLMKAISDLADKYDILAYDPAKSAQLMQEAGFNKGADGFWTSRSSGRLTLAVYADEGLSGFYTEPYGELAEKLAEPLRQAGFDRQLHLLDDNPQKVAEEGRTEIFNTWDAALKGVAPVFLLNGLGTGTNDPIDLFNSYRVKRADQDYWFNVTRWVDEKFTQATEELRKLSPDDPHAVAAFRKCMEIWYRNLPFIPIFQTYNRVPYNTRYWQNWPSTENPYTPIGFSIHDALMLVINLKAQI